MRHIAIIKHGVICTCVFGMAAVAPRAQAAVTAQEVERAIKDGVRYLKTAQRGDGSWADADKDARSGMTSLVTLALLTAGEKPSSPEVKKAIEFLHGSSPDDLRNTYSIALQTMVYAMADPVRDQFRIAANVAWLENAQIKANDPIPWPGSWSYNETKRGRPGDNSNSQYALLALYAASEAGACMWSGVATQTISMALCSLSSKRRQSS